MGANIVMKYLRNGFYLLALGSGLLSGNIAWADGFVHIVNQRIEPSSGNGIENEVTTYFACYEYRTIEQ